MTNSKHIPKRRFKEFESEDSWEIRKLREITSLITKGTTPLSKTGKGEVNFIKIENLDVSSGAILSCSKISLFEHNGYLKRSQLKENDILFSIAGTLGRIGIVESSILPANTNQALAIIRNAKCKINYLAIALKGKTVKKFILQNPTIGAQPNLSLEQIGSLDIPYPKLSEQKKIGNFFQTIETLITLHQHKLDKLKNLKKSYLAELFPAEGERLPKRRFPDFEGAWEGKKLGEITTYRNGTGHEEKQSRFGKYELVNLNSISIDGGLKPSGRFIEEASETLMKNDLVMVLSDVAHGDLLGRVAVIPENDKFVLNQRVALLRHNGIVDIKYLFSFINAHQKYFKLQGAGSSQLNLSRDSVENFEVALPSVEEQKTIGNFFEKLDKSISLQQQKLDKLKDLKKAYLNELFV